MPQLSWFESYGEDYYYGYDMTKLGMDQAYLTAISEDGTTFGIYQRHKECEECTYHKVDFELNTPFIISHVPHFLYRVVKTASSESLPTMPYEKDATNFLCDMQDYFDEFGQFGIYKVEVNRAGCYVQTIKEPVSIIFPMLTVFLIYCAIFFVGFGLRFLWNKFVAHKKEKASDKSNAKPRVQSLDTFRGISIVIMIFVNYGAGGYEFFDHAIWNGLHLADLVFPWFLWIMGVCIPISLTSSFKRQTPTKEIFLHILKRSIELFAIGLFLGSSQYLKCMRIFGVLQRFGIGYFVVSTVCLFLMDREIPEDKGNFKDKITDIIKLYRGWIVMLAIFVVHTLLLFLIADPNCPRGYMGPGGWHKDGEYEGCTGGATGYIDYVILGNHRYPYPTIREVYNSQEFDPEGILGCLTTIIQVFIGVQAGTIILVYKRHSDRLIRWLSWALITGILGGVLCLFSKNDGPIPVNKNLWSISFVLVTSCFAFVLLSFCYVMIDVKKFWSGKPFLFAGMNALIMYIGHSMTYGYFPVRWRVKCNSEHPTHFLALFENLWGTGVWILVSYYLYKIKYFFAL